MRFQPGSECGIRGNPVCRSLVESAASSGFSRVVPLALGCLTSPLRGEGSRLARPAVPDPGLVVNLVEEWPSEKLHPLPWLDGSCRAPQRPRRPGPATSARRPRRGGGDCGHRQSTKHPSRADNADEGGQQATIGMNSSGSRAADHAGNGLDRQREAQGRRTSRAGTISATSPRGVGRRRTDHHFRAALAAVDTATRGRQRARPHQQGQTTTCRSIFRGAPRRSLCSTTTRTAAIARPATTPAASPTAQPPGAVATPPRPHPSKAVQPAERGDAERQRVTGRPSESCARRPALFSPHRPNSDAHWSPTQPAGVLRQHVTCSALTQLDRAMPFAGDRGLPSRLRPRSRHPRRTTRAGRRPGGAAPEFCDAGHRWDGRDAVDFADVRAEGVRSVASRDWPSPGGVDGCDGDVHAGRLRRLLAP